MHSKNEISADIKKPAAALLLAAVLLFVFMSRFGMVRYSEKEMMDYLNGRPELDVRITELEYRSTGGQGTAGTIEYIATFEDGTQKTLRVNVTFARHLRQIGPDYRIKDFYFY